MGLVYALGDSRGPSSTPKELIALVASQHCKRQTAKEVEAKPNSLKKQRSLLSPITGLKKRPYCPKPAQPPHIATGKLVFVLLWLMLGIASIHYFVAGRRDSTHVVPNDCYSGRWSTDEHDLFLKGLAAYGKEWKKVSKMVRIDHFSHTIILLTTCMHTGPYWHMHCFCCRFRQGRSFKSALMHKSIFKNSRNKSKRSSLTGSGGTPCVHKGSNHATLAPTP